MTSIYHLVAAAVVCGGLTGCACQVHQPGSASVNGAAPAAPPPGYLAPPAQPGAGFSMLSGSLPQTATMLSDNNNSGYWTLEIDASGAITDLRDQSY